ncbi:hypothetical protein ACXWRW_10895, partial [Streptococcus pyogenes]
MVPLPPLSLFLFSLPFPPLLPLLFSSPPSPLPPLFSPPPPLPLPPLSLLSLLFPFLFPLLSFSFSSSPLLLL